MSYPVAAPATADEPDLTALDEMAAAPLGSGASFVVIKAERRAETSTYVPAAAPKLGPPIVRRNSRHATARQRRSRRRGAGRPAARRSSGPRSGADPGAEGDDEPSPERVCACGCGRSIAHKRADSRTFDAACRKRLERSSARLHAARPDEERWRRSLLLVDHIASVERAVADHDLAESTGRPLLAILTAARQDLLGLDELGRRRCQTHHGAAIVRDPDGDSLCLKCGRYRGTITSRVNGFDAVDGLMRHNGREVVV